MRFALSFNTFTKVLFTVLGAGPGHAWAEVKAGTVRAQLGWSGHITVPQSRIASAERVDSIPWWLGFGMHGNGSGTWAINGSSDGVVKLTFSEPANGRVLIFPIRPRALYLSLEDRDSFIAALENTTAEGQFSSPSLR